MKKRDTMEGLERDVCEYRTTVAARCALLETLARDGKTMAGPDLRDSAAWLGGCDGDDDDDTTPALAWLVKQGLVERVGRKYRLAEAALSVELERLGQTDGDGQTVREVTQEELDRMLAGATPCRCNEAERKEG